MKSPLGRILPQDCGSIDGASLQNPSAIYATPQLFRLAWLAIVVYHSINGLYLAGVAALYWYITTPDMEYFMPTLNLPPLRAMRLVGFSYLMLAACHAFAITTTLIATLHQRRLSFSRPRAERSNQNPQGIHGRHAASVPQTVPQHNKRLRYLANTIRISRHWWRCLFGIGGRYFEITFELREAVEIGLQTYQAYYLSKSISSTWINTLAVVIITINCFSTPAIHHVLQRAKLSVSAIHMTSVTVDAFLDFCNSVIVPFAIFLPYWQLFDVEAHDFPPDSIYDEVWFTNAVQENRQLFVMSPLDYVSSILPHVSLLLNLRTIKSFLVERPVAVAPVRPQDNQIAVTAHRKSTRYLQVATCCWGLAVVGAHVLAQRQVHTVSGCRLHNSAWFLSKPSCAVIDLDCFYLETPGSASILDDQLALVDEESLTVVAISNCPDLHMPSRIRTFPNLYGIVVFNSTITDWEDPDALHRDAFRRLNYLVFVYVNFSDTGDLPVALTQPTLPPTLQDIEIFDSNLRALPDDIDALWPNIVSLYIEFAALDAVPRAVFQLPQLEFLSLVGNALTALPDDALTLAAAVRYLTLSSNPLAGAGLPLRVSDQSFRALQAIDVEYTGVTHLPDWTWRWLATQETVRLSAVGSPVCDAATAASGVTAVETSSSSSWLSSRREICGTDAETRGGLLPAWVVTSHHAVS